VASYQWDFGDGHAGTAPSPGHSYGEGGTYAVRLTVTDNHGLTDSFGPVEVSITSQGPSAVLDSTSVTVNGEAVQGPAGGSDREGESDGGTEDLWVLQVLEDDIIRFSASGCTDPDSWYENLTFQWHFTPQTATSGTEAEYAYSTQNNNTVWLTATDETGMSDTAYLRVNVTNAAPRAKGEVAGSDGLVLTLRSSGSTDTASDREGLRYSWDFGDGEGEDTDSGEVTHTFSAPGTYRVKLTVIDDDGATDTHEFTVEVSLIGPTTATLLVVALVIFAAIGAWWHARKRKTAAETGEGEDREDEKGGRDGDGDGNGDGKGDGNRPAKGYGKGVRTDGMRRVGPGGSVRGRDDKPAPAGRAVKGTGVRPAVKPARPKGPVVRVRKGGRNEKDD
jgi:PKD repeat protein